MIRVRMAQELQKKHQCVNCEYGRVTTGGHVETIRAIATVVLAVSQVVLLMVIIMQFRMIDNITKTMLQRITDEATRVMRRHNGPVE